MLSFLIELITTIRRKLKIDPPSRPSEKPSPLFYISLASNKELKEIPREELVFDEVSNFSEYEAEMIKPYPMFRVSGECCVCNQQRDFYADFRYSDISSNQKIPNWRERLVCLSCLFNSRLRASIHIFEQICIPTKNSRIYMTEQKTPMYSYIKHNFPETVGSEYLGSKTIRGEVTRKGIRNEDLCDLTFRDNSFDVILSYDVLEHIPDYTPALKECYRVLDDKGVLLLSVPFRLNDEATLVRATVNSEGNITHLLEPEYHGNPTTRTSCLCYYHFGWELLEELKFAGFSDVKVLVYWSKRYAYLGGLQSIIVAKK
jgi:hypothetical protein